MKYGYARCSTNDTKQDINRQARELQAAGAELIFTEYLHGTDENKTEQRKLFDAVQAGDTVIVTEVSRLSRSTRQLCGLIDTIKEKRLRLEILNSITIDCRNGQLDPMTAAFLQMAGVFSELERNMISARVVSGVANAKSKGKTLGRPKLTREMLPDGFFKHYPLFKANKISKTEFARLIDVSRPTLNKYLQVAEQ